MIILLALLFLLVFARIFLFLHFHPFWGEKQKDLIILPICYLSLVFLAPKCCYGWVCLPFCRLEAVHFFFFTHFCLCQTFFSNARAMVQCLHLTQYHHFISFFQNSLLQNSSEQFSTLPSLRDQYFSKDISLASSCPLVGTEGQAK